MLDRMEIMQLALEEKLQYTDEQLQDMSTKELEEAILVHFKTKMNERKVGQAQANAEKVLDDKIRERFDRRMRGETPNKKEGNFWDILEGRKK